MIGQEKSYWTYEDQALMRHMFSIAHDEGYIDHDAPYNLVTIMARDTQAVKDAMGLQQKAKEVSEKVMAKLNDTFEKETEDSKDPEFILNLYRMFSDAAKSELCKIIAVYGAAIDLALKDEYDTIAPEEEEDEEEY